MPVKQLTPKADGEYHGYIQLIFVPNLPPFPLPLNVLMPIYGGGVLKRSRPSWRDDNLREGKWESLGRTISEWEVPPEGVGQPGILPFFRKAGFGIDNWYDLGQRRAGSRALEFLFLNTTPGYSARHA